MARRKSKRKEKIYLDNPTLSNSAKRLFQRIRDNEEDGLTGRESLNRLRSQGYHISNANFYSARRAARAFRLTARKVKYSKGDYIVPIEQIPNRPTTGIFRGNVQYVLKVSAESIDEIDDNGNPVKITDYITVRSAAPLSKNQINKVAMAIIESGMAQQKENYTRLNLSTIDFGVEEVFKRTEPFDA